MELICQSCTMESFQVVGPNEELVYLQRHSLRPTRLREDGRTHFRISTLSASSLPPPS